MGSILKVLSKRPPLTRKVLEQKVIMVRSPYIIGLIFFTSSKKLSFLTKLYIEKNDFLRTIYINVDFKIHLSLKMVKLA
jgi:hypothetical protein